MLQDNLRSAVYGSFVTCDDPKGIVGCGMTRKSKWFPENRAEDGKSKNSRTKFGSQGGEGCCDHRGVSDPFIFSAHGSVQRGSEAEPHD
ncbi:hypothetical protein ACFX2I_026164 [Malus domestica]|uniref:Uncharacterized protein n=2 Tax=Malus domestica TaxID=3750 RepID=A0A498KDZ1_MALDO|nr:hypothetical protein DVH24_017850 [Malus domestica]